MVTKKFVAPKATGGKSKSSGADTTAQVGGTNPRGQILGVPEGYVAPMWIAGRGPASDQQYRDYRQAPYMTPDDRAATGQSGIDRWRDTHDAYREADAWLPANEPAKIVEIQQKLIKAGLLDPAAPGYTPGLWGANEVAAYRSVLSNANINGVDRNTMLDYMLDHPGYSANPTKQMMLSSPISIQAAFEQAFKSTLGKRPSPEQTAAFVHSWQQYEVQGLTGQTAAQAAFKKDPTGAPKSITDVASPSDFAQNYVDTNFAGDEANVGYQHGLDLVGNLISSSKTAGG